MMTTLKNIEPEEFEFRGPEGLDILKKRIQLMANILGECVYVTGYAQTYRNLRLTPASHFVPSINVSILWACWPIGFHNKRANRSNGEYT